MDTEYGRWHNKEPPIIAEAVIRTPHENVEHAGTAAGVARSKATGSALKITDVGRVALALAVHRFRGFAIVILPKDIASPAARMIAISQRWPCSIARARSTLADLVPGEALTQTFLHQELEFQIVNTSSTRCFR